MLNQRTVRVLRVLTWGFLALALFFAVWWVLHLLGVPLPGDAQEMSKIENYKYLGAELLPMMFFWVVFLGRGYCYYCPLGTVLGLVGRLADQRIDTNCTRCIQCNRCDSACPMSIDIKTRAHQSVAVRDLRCVGCGHCVDACPTKTLAYKTRFWDLVGRSSKHREEDSL